MATRPIEMIYPEPGECVSLYCGGCGTRQREFLMAPEFAIPPVPDEIPLPDDEMMLHPGE